MTSSHPSGRPTSGSNVPPTSRRSARQQRLANREANRALSRAGTRGSGGTSGKSLLLYTLGALVVAAVVIGLALFLNQPKSARPLISPYPPQASVLTPSSIPTNGRTLGNADAPHTMDLYEDFQCTVCWIFTNQTEPQVVTNYVATGKLKIVFHDLLVIDSTAGGTESLDAANAALCATDQGMFWPYHDWLFANQYQEGSGAFTKDRLKTIAIGVGIPDLNKFNSCVDNGSHNSDVKAEAAPTQSTPTIVIDGGAPLGDYSYAVVSAALDKALGITPSPSIGASGSVAPSGSIAPSTSPSAKPS